MNPEKLYHAKHKASAALRFSSFFENAFVGRVNLRSRILTVKSCLSTWDVEMCCGGFGLPMSGTGRTSTILEGLYRSRLASSPARFTLVPAGTVLTFDIHEKAHWRSSIRPRLQL
jgi:hypothetical protein